MGRKIILLQEGQTTGRILEEITARYTLGYVPSTGPGEGFHRVDVKLSAPREHPGVKIRTRPGYYVYPAGLDR